MKYITVSGPPSSGKTSVILHMIRSVPDYKSAVVKFDCLTASDEEQYQNAGIKKMFSAGKKASLRKEKIENLR